jgi:DNA-binding transcriptional LysR family regulator
MLDSFAAAKSAVIAGDAIGLAPLTAIESELRSGKVVLVPFDAPWLHMSYGLFYPRKRSLSRAAQLFVTQLRQVETDIQAREHRAVSRLNLRRQSRKKGAKARKTTPGGGAKHAPARKRSR